MKKDTYLGLLNDSIIGHLLCVYLKLYTPVEGKYYFVIKSTDRLIASLPQSLEKLGLCNIKLTFGTELISAVDRYKRNVAFYSIQSVTGQRNANLQHYKDKLEQFEELLNKHTVHETPVNRSELEKFGDDKEVEKCLSYVISFNAGQYKKLSSFLKKYVKLFLEKELDGQQSYALPELYVRDITSFINNPEYIKVFGYKNLQLNKKDEPFFGHSIMVLVMQKKIKIRRMYVVDEAIHTIIDNLASSTISVEEVIRPSRKQPDWPSEFKWISETEFSLGHNNSVKFGKSDSDRINLFKMLANARCDWVEVKAMAHQIKKSEGQTRVTIGQINNENLKNKPIEIIERNDKDKPGAYRINIK